MRNMLAIMTVLILLGVTGCTMTDAVKQTMHDGKAATDKGAEILSSVSFSNLTVDNSGNIHGTEIIQDKISTALTHLYVASEAWEPVMMWEGSLENPRPYDIEAAKKNISQAKRDAMFMVELREIKKMLMSPAKVVAGATGLNLELYGSLLGMALAYWLRKKVVARKNGKAEESIIPKGGSKKI